DYRQALIGTLALVPQVVDAVCVPVIAAGGIMDARGVVACLALGAAGVQMGTAFLGCPEAPVAPVWRQALKDSDGESSTVTEAISGRPARGLRNRYIEEVEGLGEPLLPYPAQYSVSRVLRKAATDSGDGRFLAMWSGQAASLIREEPAADLVARLVRESSALLTRLGGGVGGSSTD
ncbi:MAG: nitronate monooxygenase, partial [Gammaproteobacteria bacterium]|nr:nitronate monooxygenase [Gammaproteobacteria bacterium]